MRKQKLRKIMSVVLAIALTTAMIPTGTMAKKEEVKAATLSNPRIVSDSSMESGQKVTWDCVWFGSYPQAEVIPSGDYTALDSSLLQDGDTIVSDTLYARLQSATGWDANGDITIDGTKYRRIKKSDATYTITSSHYYSWSDSTTYHYFKYEPIKWRVLNVDGDEAFLLADKALDDQRYNTTDTSVTWETSTIRSWLNGYGASSNAEGTDYTGKNFIDTAFSADEQSAIQMSTVINDDNLSFGTEGGNNTNDKVFLLSESEIYTDSAASYGFVSGYSTDDEARRSRSSTYAKAMGTYSYTGTAYAGNCWWWLRSPGCSGNSAASVDGDGYVRCSGDNVSDDSDGCRPALRLNLSSSNLYSYAGTVCSDGSEDEMGGGEIVSGGDTVESNSQLEFYVYKAGALMEYVADASISVEDCDTVYTDGEGKATVNYHLEDEAMSQKQVTIKKDGYRDYIYYQNIYNSETPLLFYSNSFSIYMNELKQGDNTNPYVSSMVYYDNQGECRDVLNRQTTFTRNLESNICNFRVCGVWNGKTPDKYVIYQENGKTFESKDGIFQIDMGSALDAKYKVYVKMIAADGTESEATPTSIKIEGMTSGAGTSGNTLTLMESNETSISNSVPFLNGQSMKLKIGKDISITASYKDDKIRIMLGADAGKLEAFTDEDWAQWKKLCETQPKDLNLSQWGNIVSSLKSDYTSSCSLDGKAYGYLEGSINQSGDTIVSGVVKFEEDGNVSFQTQYMVGPVPVYAKIGIGGKGSAEGNLTYNFTQNSLVKEDSSMTLTLEPYLKGEGGVGVLCVATVGVEGTASLPITGNLSTGEMTAKLRGELALKASVLCFDYSYKFAYKEYDLLSGAVSSSRLVKSTVTKSANYEVMDRDYIEEDSEWIGSSASISAFSAENISDTRLLQTNIYPGSEIQLIETDNTKMALWTVDESSRSDVDRSMLVYSVYNETDDTWSEPVAVDDDKTADYMPCVTADNTHIYLAWQNMNATFSDDATLDEVAKAGRISAKIWTDGEGFGDTIQISTSELSTSPCICTDGNGNTTVTWLQNSDNEIYQGSGSNKLVSAEITTSTIVNKEIIRTENVITAFDAAYVDGTYQVAYSEDLDGDISTTTDREVYVCSDNGAKTSMSSNQITDSNPQYAKINNHTVLVWYSDDGIMMEEEGTIKNICDVNNSSITDDYEIISDDAGRAAIVWTSEKTSGGKQIEGIVYDSITDSWSNSIQISNDDANVYAPSGIYLSDGSLQFLYKETDGDMTNLCLTTSADCKNLSLDNVYYDESEYDSENGMPVMAQVTNTGRTAVDGFAISIDGQETLINEQVAPGETKYVTAYYQLSDDYEYGTRTVALSFDEDSDASDNVQEIIMGYTDFTIKVDDNVNDAGHMVEIGVANSSMASGSGIIEIRKDSLEGELINTISVDTLSRGELFTVNYGFSAEELKALGTDAIYFNFVSDEEEKYTNDNYDYIVISDETNDSNEEQTSAKPEESTDNQDATTTADNQDNTTTTDNQNDATTEPTTTKAIETTSSETVTTKSQNGTAADTVNNTTKENSSNAITNAKDNTKTTKIKKLKKAKKSLKVKWKKVKGITGYQIQYSTTKKFKKAKKITIKKATKTSRKIKKLKSKKKYYVRIRTYITVNGKKYYSAWSKAKSKKTK